MTPMPIPNLDIVEKNLTEEQCKVAEQLWSSLWACYIRNKGTTSGVYWLEQFADPVAFNVFLMIQKDWIISHAIPERNWASLELNEKQLLTEFTEQELLAVRTDRKYSKYIPKFKESTASNLVRQNGVVKDTGLVREGFARAANSQYFYDTPYLIKYEHDVKAETTKGMAKLREQMPNLVFDDASYDAISAGVVDELKTPKLLTQGKSYIDSRGRAIKESLKYVANPIGYKVFRSLVTIPESTDVMTVEAIEAVYMFIAELLGYKRGTVAGKLKFGKQSYKKRTLPEDLAERIWLERHYNELDALFVYSTQLGTMQGFHYRVPIELDASASMLGFTGALLGSEELLTMCNMAGDVETLNDPWHIDKLTREHVKTAATPKLYGSSATVMGLWEEADLEYSTEELAIMNRAFNKGAIGLADQFKEFVINNCNMKEEMHIKIWHDEFKVTCNHWKKVGDAPVIYDIYDTETGGIRRITHMKTKMIPDLDRFRTFTQTLLIHNLDGQVADTVAGKCYDKYGFCLDIHDAFVCSPVAATDVRGWYSKELTKLWCDRDAILKDYLTSIGIVNFNKLNELMEIVDKITDFKCRPHVLK